MRSVPGQGWESRERHGGKTDTPLLSWPLISSVNSRLRSGNPSTCSHTHTLPVLQRAELLALINGVDLPSRGHSRLQRVSAGRGLSDPTVPTASPSGFMMDPHGSGLRYVHQQRDISNLDMAFPRTHSAMNIFFKKYPLCLPRHLWVVKQSLRNADRLTDVRVVQIGKQKPGQSDLSRATGPSSVPVPSIPSLI